jgi:hypothetical protein
MLDRLLDHLIGGAEHPWRHLNVERSCRLKVELEFSRLPSGFS